MQSNPLPLQKEQTQEQDQNLSVEAKKLMLILNELEDFTLQLKKKLLTEFSSEKKEG